MNAQDLHFGYRPDMPDERDLKVGVDFQIAPAISAAIPEYHMPVARPVRDQGATSRCVAFATATALEVRSDVIGRPLPDVSHNFIYYNARAQHSETDRDDGTYIRSGCKTFKSLGIVPETSCSDSSSMFMRPPIIAYSQANASKITGYYRIDSGGEERLDAIDRAVRANLPVIFGTRVGQEFLDYSVGDGDSPDRVFDLPKSYVGGHAMVVVGVRNPSGERQFEALNSWSRSWGNNGRAWLSSSYLGSYWTGDVWVVTL